VQVPPLQLAVFMVWYPVAHTDQAVPTQVVSQQDVRTHVATVPAGIALDQAAPMPVQAGAAPQEQVVA